ncbi:MAG: acyl carrier protein [Pirellulales bacterium]
MQVNEAGQVEEKLKQVVLDVLKIDPSQYDEDLAAGDLPEWDSIGHVNLLMAVEKEFDVAFDVADAIDVESIGDLQDLLKRYLAQRGAA